VEYVDGNSEGVPVLLRINEVDRIKTPQTHEHANLLLPLGSEFVTQQGRLPTRRIEQRRATYGS
jgi:hypothetical protein